MTREFVWLVLSALLLFSVDGKATGSKGSALESGNQRKCEDTPASASLILTPLNTAVVVGQQATINCRSNSSKTLTWFFIPLDGRVPYDVVIAECAVNPDYADRVEVDNRTDGHCNLIVLEAEEQDAGIYSCFQPQGFDRASGAQLAVITVEPYCTTNTTDLFEFEFVELVCTVNYTNNIAPMYINWVDDSSETIDPTEDITLPGYSLSRVILEAHPPNLREFHSVTYFSTPADLPSSADNRPEYEYIWYSPQTLVKPMLMVPEDTEASLGDFVNMTCRRRTQDIAWSFIPIGQQESHVIVSACRVVPSEEEKYRVDTELYACNLIIDSVTASHEGTYTCQDYFTPGDTFHTATLTIV